MKLAVALLIAGVVLCAAFPRAQAPSVPQGAAQPGPPPPRTAMPPRDGTAGAIPTGTARIRGRVVAVDSGTPLRRAHVRVSASELRVTRVVRTDAEGRYDVADLPAGRYVLTVTRNGYVSLQFGQQRPFEPGRPLELADGQLIERVDFALPRGSVISGRVTDELGEPVAGVRMQAMRYRYLPSGERQLVPANLGGMFNIVSNDLGEFRVFGLMPGTYVLSANPDDGGMMGISGGVISGFSTSGDSDGYATTYYPGTLSAEGAEPINVGVADVASVSFALSTARMTRISGTVRDSQGRPLSGARLMIRSGAPAGGFARGLPPLGADGQFSLAHVPPGEYVLEVMAMMRGAANAGPEFDEVASVPVTAAGRDITDLLITTSPGATLTGRVIFEGTSQIATPGRILVQPPDPRIGMMYRSAAGNGVIDANGRFQLRGITGRALFRFMPLSPERASLGWTLKSVTLNGADITDTPVDVASLGDADGVEITLTNTATLISGTVTNARREPVNDYVVVILPDRLPEGALPQRFTRSVRPNQEGQYQTRGLPAGDYLAAALPMLEEGSEWDPAFRKQIEQTAKRFRLTDGQTAIVDLQLIQ